jgi:hypothetical protein
MIARYRSRGWLVILPYFFIFYIVPLLLMCFMGPHRNFLNEGNVFLLFIVIIWTLFFTYFLSKLKISLPIKFLSKLPNIFENRTIIFILAIVFLPLAIKFHLDFGAGFRYSGEEISKSGVLPQLITIYKSFFVGYVMYSFFLSLKGRYFSPAYRLNLFLHTVNWVLCANGSVDIFWIATAIIICYKGKSSTDIFTISKADGTIFKSLTLYLLSFVAVFGVIFFGYANKVGFEDAYIIFVNEFFERVVYYLYYRLSVFLSSLDLILSKGIDINFYMAVITTEVEVFMYRLGVIFHFSYPRPDIEGINRLNYLLLWKSPILDRAGATPGPLATFAYLPVFPLNFIIGALYLSVIKNTFSRIVFISAERRASLFSLLLFAIICFAFFHNPLSSFIKIGPELFKTLMFIYVFGATLKTIREERIE